jgi:phosphatidate phosphatase APP1
MIRFFLLSSILIALISGACNRKSKSNPNPQPGPVPIAEKEVTFYPAYAYLQDDNWVIHLRAWVHKRRTSLNQFTTILATLTNRCNGGNMDFFKSRSEVFEYDDKFNENLIIEFDADTDKTQYSGNERSNQNGIVEFSITLAKEKAMQLLAAQKTSSKWLTYRTLPGEYSGVGRIRLMEPQGISIISDIDDTIKVSEIPAGTDKVFDYTFCREFEAAPEMAARFQGWNAETGDPNWKDVAFHYVSGGPQQLFEPLYNFLIAGKGGFPEGTFHLRFFPKNLLEKDTRDNLKRFSAAPMNTTFEHKVNEITKLIKTFPGRKFILVGDSGEVDPEVYHEIRKAHGDKILHIWIRDVVGDAQENDYRLKDMEIIAVTPVVCMEEGHYQSLRQIVEDKHNPNLYRKKRSPNCE